MFTIIFAILATKYGAEALGGKTTAGMVGALQGFVWDIFLWDHLFNYLF